MLKIVQTKDLLSIYFQDLLILNHSKANPCFYVGNGSATYDMLHGNFQIEEHLTEKLAPWVMASFKKRLGKVSSLRLKPARWL